MKEKGVYLNIKKRGKRTEELWAPPQIVIFFLEERLLNDTIFNITYEYSRVLLLSHTFIRFCRRR